MEHLSNYVPLFQSFIGALGALAVAVFTVALTARHTRTREEEKDRRSRHVARVGDLKDRLDACTDLIASAFRLSTGSARHAILAVSDEANAKRPLLYEVPLDDHFSLMNQAITRAELHFVLVKFFRTQQ